MKTLLTLLISTTAVAGSISTYSFPHNQSNSNIIANEPQFSSSIKFDKKESASGFLAPIKDSDNWYGVIFTNGKINFYQDSLTNSNNFTLLDSLDQDNINYRPVPNSLKSVKVGENIYFQYACPRKLISMGICQRTYKLDLITQKASFVSEIELDNVLIPNDSTFDNTKMYYYNKHLIYSYGDVLLHNSYITAVDLNTNTTSILTKATKISDVTFVDNKIYYLFANDNNSYTSVGIYDLNTNTEEQYINNGFVWQKLLVFNNELYITLHKEGSDYRFAHIVLAENHTIAVQILYINNLGIWDHMFTYNNETYYVIIDNLIPNRELGLLFKDINGTLSLANIMYDISTEGINRIEHKYMMTDNNVFIGLFQWFCQQNPECMSLYSAINLETNNVTTNEFTWGSHLNTSAVIYDNNSLYFSQTFKANGLNFVIDAFRAYSVEY